MQTSSTKDALIDALVGQERLFDEPFFRDMKRAEYNLHEADLADHIRRAIDLWREGNVRND